MSDKVDWKGLEKLHMSTGWTPEERTCDTDPFIQPQWDIPKKIGIQVALSGGGARLHNANPNQPRDMDAVYESAVECIEAGPPTAIHFDLDNPRAMHTRDGKEFQRGDAYMHIIKPLLEKYGREKVCPHLNTMHGTFLQQMLPVITGLAELTYNHSLWPSAYANAVIPLQKKYGMRGEMAIHHCAEIESCNRVFIKSGLMPNPNLWNILIGAAQRNNGISQYEYIPNERAMAHRLALIVQDIKAIDPDGYITVCASGRASTYLMAQAMILGCHIRMGMEDTVWWYPNSDEMITNSVDTLKWAFDMSRLLGREPMTPNEFRETVLMTKARFDHAETLIPIPPEAKEYTDLEWLKN